MSRISDLEDFGRKRLIRFDQFCYVSKSCVISAGEIDQLDRYCRQSWQSLEAFYELSYIYGIHLRAQRSLSYLSRIALEIPVFS